MLGIVGGTGPESTIDYYKSIISLYQKRIGSTKVLPELLIKSINMYKIFSLIDDNQIDELADYITQAVQSLADGGASFAILSANTPHLVYDQVQARVSIPMISIVQETLKESNRLGLERVGLMGTKFTMAHDFFKKPFINEGKGIVVPSEEEQKDIHHLIEEELEVGIFKEETKKKFLKIIQRMVEEEGIQGMILGCTELPLLLKSGDASIPLLNTTEIHVNSIVTRMYK